MQPPATTTMSPDSTEAPVETTTAAAAGVCTGCPTRVPAKLPENGDACYGITDNPFPWTYSLCENPNGLWGNTAIGGECVSE
ncbi:unnamed protein product, partial [Mesorhabditis spiculigera]